MRAPWWRPMTWPKSIPKTMLAITTSVSIVPAASRDMPWASTRYGRPHSSRNTMPENCVVKCTHIPSRVPGSRQDAAICRFT